MSGKKPCCAAEAARMDKKLSIGGIPVGISHFDSIIEEVLEMGLNDEKEIKEELLKKVKIYNYVSPGSEEDYANALFTEYKRQGGIID
ncbi:MAG: hypothetical protein V3U20_07265 [Thermoplasmata archaeon]